MDLSHTATCKSEDGLAASPVGDLPDLEDCYLLAYLPKHC